MRSRWWKMRRVLDLAAFVAVVTVKAWVAKRLWDRWRSRRRRLPRPLPRRVRIG
jgi:hypothetical protein